MNIRNQRQQEASESYKGGRKLIKAAPRFGKIKTSINIFNIRGDKKICICSPRNEIKDSWVADFKKWNFEADVTYSTYHSVKKITGEFDIVILDEINEASSQQLKNIRDVFKNQKDILALSGTVTQKSFNEINYHLGIEICYEYSIDMAVKEKIITDYRIFVHRVKLDDQELPYKNKSGKRISERTRFSNYLYVRDKLKDEGQDYFFMELKLIKMLQDSTAKFNKTKELLEQFKYKRCLVFCGLTEVADRLGIPVYHSKAKEKEIFKDFCEGRNYDHLACIKLIQSGITVKPIDHGIMNYLSGAPEDTCQKICRMFGFEYNTPDKVAQIHIVSTTEGFEQERLESALMFFDKEKIQYL